MAGKGFGRSTDEHPAISSYDLVHIPLQQNFRPFQKNKTPKLITIHDFTHAHFPQFHTRDNVRNAEEGVHFAQQSGAEILAVSQATAEDAARYSGISPGRIHVVHEAADPKMFHKVASDDRRRATRRKYGLDFDSPYIICLSTLEPRKNLENTIAAFVGMLDEQPGLDVRLVIAGKRGWNAEEVFRRAGVHQGSIYFTGFVDDEDLACLYSDALCLSYVSFYEGFGLPPLEAMCCGTPVVYGNNSSLIEVVAEGGLAADPANVDEIKEKFLLMCQDDTLRQAKSRAALRQANRFSWRRAAIETLDLYRKLIDEPA